MAASAATIQPAPRVIVHIDLDCFYAQVEIRRRPELHDRPVGVRQKQLVVTSNYVARRLGVPKCCSVDEAMKACPALVVLDGEDLTPYREANTMICEILKKKFTCTPHLERLGLDEFFLDVSAECAARASIGAHSWDFQGHVIGMGGEVGVHAEDVPLLSGSQIAAEIREALRRELGFTVSAGISVNKTAAKLAGKTHKPDDQTVLLGRAVADFLAPLPARRLPGVGRVIADALADLGIQSVAELRAASGAALRERFGERVAALLQARARGEDEEEVKGLAPPKSVSEEDALKGVESEAGAERVAGYLAAALADRLAQDAAEHARRATTLRVAWKTAAGGWARVSRQGPMPLEGVTGEDAAARGGAIARAAVAILRRHLRPPFVLRMLNLAATAFEAEAAGGAAAITAFFRRDPPGARPSPGKRPRTLPAGEASEAPRPPHDAAVEAPEAAGRGTGGRQQPGEPGRPEPPAAPAEEEEDLVCLGPGPPARSCPSGGAGADGGGGVGRHACGRCGAAVGPGERERMEHEDHHLALDIQRRQQLEAGPVAAAGPARATPQPAASGGPGKRARGKVKGQAGTCGTPTLHSFFGKK